jgi:hypothetical protein
MSGVTRRPPTGRGTRRRPSSASASVRAFGLDRVRRLPLVHAVGAALVDHALGVAQDDVVGRTPIALSSSVQAIAAAPAPLQTSLDVFDVAAGEVSALIRPAAAMIAVPCWSSWKTGMFSARAALLDDEALGRLDVLEVDAAEARLEQLTQLMNSSGPRCRPRCRSTSMSAKRLNSTALPSITGLAASAPRLPRPRIAVPLVMTATRLPLAV